MKRSPGEPRGWDQTAALAELGERYRLPLAVQHRLGVLVALIASDPLAPTTVRDRRRIVEDHVADSLVALELEAVRSAGVIADLGAGAGFPGLPLALALPASSVKLVESNGRKCDFLARAAKACEADNAAVTHTRVESWSAGTGSCDLVVARALAPLAVLAEYAAPLLRLGGTLLGWRGRRDLADEASGARAARELGLEAAAPLRVAPYPDALHRHLHAMVKVSATPARYPRRPGVARKRPLGGAPARRSDREQR